MKICWDNLNGLYLSNQGYLRKNGTTYYEKVCKYCGNIYLGKKNSVCCENKCASKGKNNPMYGKKHNIEWKKQHSEIMLGENNPMYGKHHTKEVKKYLSNINKNKIPPNKKGGLNWVSYDTYAIQLELCEKVRNNKGKLEISCNYCGRWFIPKMVEVKNRLSAFNGKRSISTENRLYCSKSCKKECPVYRQKIYPKDFKIATSREVQPELRQMVFKRDDYKCVKCGSSKSLHCHHVEGIRWEPIESADIDKCITLCKKCHKEVHMKEGCKYYEMRCN